MANLTKKSKSFKINVMKAQSSKRELTTKTGEKVKLNSPKVICDTAYLILKDKNGKPKLDYLGREMLDEDAWLLRRKEALPEEGLDIEVPYQIGGSAASYLTGSNPYNNRCTYWRQLKGLEKTEKVDNDATRSGHIYEPQLRDKFGDIMTRLGKTVKISNDTRMFRCGHIDENGDLVYPHMIADVDGIVSVDGKVGILECKTLNVETPNGRKIRDEFWLNGIVPPYYEDQVRHYMCVMNLDFAYVICGWGPLDSQTAIIKVERDFEKEEALCNLESEFVQSLIDDNEPDERFVPVDDLLILYGKKYAPVIDSKDDAISISEDYDLDIKQLLSVQEQEEKIDKQIEELKKKKEQIHELGQESELELMKLLGDNEKAYGMYELDDKHIVWVHSNRKKKRTSYNITAIKSNFPELWDKAGSESFSASKLSTAEKTLIASCKNPVEYDKKRTFSISVSEKK